MANAFGSQTPKITKRIIPSEDRRADFQRQFDLILFLYRSAMEECDDEPGPTEMLFKALYQNLIISPNF